MFRLRVIAHHTRRVRRYPGGLGVFSKSGPSSLGTAARISVPKRCLASTSCLHNLSYRQADPTVPLLGKTIGQVVEETTEKFPNREYVVFSQDGVRRTFAQFKEEVDQLAAGLLAIGIERNDRVGIWGPSTLEWVLTQYASAQIGAILVNLNPAYRPQELEYAMKKVGVKGIVSAQTFKTQNYYEMLEQICPELATSTPGNIRSENLPMLRSVIMMGQGNFPGAFNFDSVMEYGKGEHYKEIERLKSVLQFDDPINIQFTSGTTGNPKGATLTHHNILNNSYFIGNKLKYGEKEHRISVPVPLYHCFGMVAGSLSAMVYGATCVIPTRSFEAEGSLRVIQEESITSRSPLSKNTTRGYHTLAARHNCAAQRKSKIEQSNSRSSFQTFLCPSSFLPHLATSSVSFFSTSSSSSSQTGGTDLAQRALKMSYVQGDSAPPLVGKTLGQCLEDIAEEKPDHEAFVFVEDGVRMTFSQFKEKVDRLAAGFIAIGIQKGDRVGVWATNTPEWVLTQFATAKIGAILVTINLAYRTNELHYALQKAGVKAIVSSQNFHTQNYYEMLSTVCPELATSAPGRLKSDKLPMLESIIMLGQGDFPGAFMFDDVIDMGTSEHMASVEQCMKTVQFDDPIAIMFTSGTTGNPKGATITHHRLVNQGFHIGYRVGYHKGDHRMCLPIPLYHIFASVGGPIIGAMYGVTNVYPTSGYNPQAALQAVQDEKCTFIYGTPTMFIDMMSQPIFKDLDLGSLRCGIIGGAPCTPEILKTVTKGMGMDYIAAGYGSTEAGPMLSIVTEDMREEKKLTTVGRFCQHMEGKVVDPQTGTILPVNTPGELCVRGYALMTGYWENEEATRESMDETRWFHTGDIATFDEEGHCSIVGRIKELIIRGGRNVYPVDVEKYIHSHPKVEDVQVIGIPDHRLGEEVVACVRVKAGEELTEEEVINFCKGEISHFTIPRHVVFMDVFPMTVTGKVQKFKLQEMVAMDLKRD